MTKWLVLTAAMLIASAAHANEQCALRELASFDLVRLSSGALAIPVTIDGKQQVMVVDVSNPFSFLGSDYGDAEKLHGPMPPARYSASFNPSHQLYEVPEFVIGNNAGKDVVFTRMEGKLFQGEAVGELAVDMLRRFDVELDLKNNKLNLFSGDHCPGKVVYWTTSPYAAIPLNYDKIGHPYFKMKLDGKAITVAFTLSASSGRMSMATATRIFDIGENSFGLSAAADAPADAPIYRFPFKSLSMSDVSINNLKINIYPKMSECRSDVTSYEHGKRYLCFGGSDVYLGQEELKQVHLFYAFSEGMLYITAADARLQESTK